MKHLFIFFLLAFLIPGCKENKSKDTLEDAFLFSLQKNDFELLNDHLPDMAFYKSLGDKMPAKSDEEINKFIADNNETIKVAWQNTLFNAAGKKVDLNKVAIKEVIYYDPFKQDEESEAMIINYTYNNQTWDDLQFIVNRSKNKTYLLGIPNPTRAFSFSDPLLRASTEAKLLLELGKPEFKNSLDERVKSIIAAVKENDINEFGSNLVYRGNDETRRWKTALNVNDSLEKQQAMNFMDRVSRAVEGCADYKTGEINTERESEGTWIILPLQCGDKTVQFAFLKIGDKVLLGDIDAR